MLTDYEGKFQCDADAGAATITATKPGYFFREDPAESASLTLRAPFPDTPAEIRLYPEALLTGSVTAPNGEFLQGIVVQAKRSLYDELGHHWVQAGTTRTDSHGSFRLPVSAGEYVLQSLFSNSSLLQEAVLPVTVPGDDSSNGRDTIRIRSGEIQHVDLHAATAHTFVVTAHLAPDTGRGNLRVVALGNVGGDIPLQASSTGVQGEVRLDVPSGAYLVQATRRTAEGVQEAETRVSVSDHDVGGATLQFSATASIPIEVQLDTSATSTINTPTVSDLGLTLQRVQASFTSSTEDSEHPLLRGNLPPSFNPLPGSYRLRARSGGTWFVRSATYGNGDLLHQNLVVTQGGGAVPIRILASSQTATLSGIVRSNGTPAVAWIYLISTTPSATPLLILHTNNDGTYIRTAVPPGSYRAIAFEHRHAADFEDPATLTSFANELHSITLNAGDKGSLDLELAPFPESH